MEKQACWVNQQTLPGPWIVCCPVAPPSEFPVFPAILEGETACAGLHDVPGQHCPPPGDDHTMNGIHHYLTVSSMGIVKPCHPKEVV